MLIGNLFLRRSEQCFSLTFSHTVNLHVQSRTGFEIVVLVEIFLDCDFGNHNGVDRVNCI